MNPITKRITAAFGAGAFGQISNTLIQLFSLPIFLKYWDVHTYGIWLMYSAIPGYLSMADIGMVQAAGNRMTMEIGRGNIVSANRIFQSALSFMTVACIGFAVISISMLAWAPFTRNIATGDKYAIGALLLSVLVALFCGLSEAIFKSTNRYAYGTMLGNIVRLSEWGGWIAGLILFETYSGVALTGLSVRVCGTLLMSYLSAQNSMGITWGFGYASAHEVKSSLKPALSFMAFPMANALSFQGITLLVGTICGAPQVVLFNAYRTLARAAVQVTGVFSNSIWAELSRLFGIGGPAAIKAIYIRAFKAGIAGATAISLILLLASPWILSAWTHDRVPFDLPIIAVLLLYAAIGGSWHVPRVLLMSTNQHISLSNWSIGSSFLLFLLAYALGSALGLLGFGVAMLLTEALIAFICIRLASAVFK